MEETNFICCFDTYTSLYYSEFMDSFQQTRYREKVSEELQFTTITVIYTKKTSAVFSAKTITKTAEGFILDVDSRTCGFGLEVHIP